MNKALLKKVQERLTEIGIKYETNENIIQFIIGINDLIGSLRIYIEILDNHILTYAVLNNKCSISKIDKIAEYLHRANYGLVHGNFEIDYSDGEIRYKLTTLCQNVGSFPNGLIDTCIILPCKMFEKYGKGIIKSILHEGDPKELVEEAESNN